MLNRLLCWLFDHDWHVEEVWLPQVIAGVVYCRRCGEPGWIERH